MSERRSFPTPKIETPSSSSGRTSKNTSPVRAASKHPNFDQEGMSQSNSNTSPTRAPNSASYVPSASAIQRALASTKTAGANNDSSSDAYRDRRQRSGPNVPQWPTSPRLKSPPPVSMRSITSQMTEHDYSQSNTVVRRLAPVSSIELSAAMHVPQNTKESASQSSMRVPGRGVSAAGTGLETVAEGSVPMQSSMKPMSTQPESFKSQVSKSEHIPDANTESVGTRDVSASAAGENNIKMLTDKAETAPSSRATSMSRPAPNLAKRSITSLTGKSKAAVEPLRTMTVETETVNSAPQLITDRGREAGSIRAKPSTETIRPKKEKKKTTRKTPSLHAGMNSSKADIFEAKVASAVDEADSSDSDETFVYESNPPEPRHARHHSRTPSATSVASQVADHGGRGKHGVRNNSTAIGGKKSMKFSNSMYGSQLEAESAGDGRNSTRTTSSTPRHHHINRHGRNGHASIIDTDSPFTQTNRGTSPFAPSVRNSRPSSPRNSNGRLQFSRKSVAAGYDAYDDAADDERTPLVGSVRVNRTRHSRRPYGSSGGNHFRPMQFNDEEERTCWPRFSGCFCLGFLITLVCIGVAVFVVVLNRPLMDVEIRHIQNVLASEQELMLDLKVQAANPNLFAITVNELDINVFAESPYVGTASEWEKSFNTARPTLAQRRRQRTVRGKRIPFWFPPFHPDDGVDEGTDPIDDDPESGSHKMLLGRIFNFDSPLVFDPSPLRHNIVTSVGEIRLTKPGNKTEAGGTERWERVLQHPFDLIVRGVMRYQLPLSSNSRSAKLAGRIRVSPGGDDDDDNNSSSVAVVYTKPN